MSVVDLGLKLISPRPVQPLTVSGCPLSPSGAGNSCSKRAPAGTRRLTRGVVAVVTGDLPAHEAPMRPARIAPDRPKPQVEPVRGLDPEPLAVGQHVVAESGGDRRTAGDDDDLLAVLDRDLAPRPLGQPVGQPRTQLEHLELDER